MAIPPDRLFAAAPFRGTLETAFLSIPHESHEVRVEAVGPDWIADRQVFLLRADRQRFDARYLAFRYAFPERGSRLIESAAELEREIVVEALRKTDTYAFYHPSPISAQALFPALSNAPYKRYIEIGEGTHTVIMEKNRMSLFSEVQLFLDEVR